MELLLQYNISPVARQSPDGRLSPSVLNALDAATITLDGIRESLGDIRQQARALH